MQHTVDYAFLHGGGQGGWIWNEVIAALRQQTGGQVGRTIALDIPGCGEKQGRDITNVDADDVADELLSDLANANVKDVILVGHSMAGTILPRLVEKKPDLFRRVVYTSCCAPLQGQSILKMMGSGEHGDNSDEVGWPRGTSADDWRQRNRIMFCNDMNESETSEFLAKLGRDAWPDSVMGASDWRYNHLGATPSTYVICLKDGVLPVPWQEIFASRFKARRLVRIDAGHQVMNTRPHALAEILWHEAASA
ncbi:MAG: alpha/beta hydrolase [Rhodospirillaceae bacterium]|nr:MAG: alpha/beta hydrolase [Rhodospirillaceae bacterium]